MFKNWVLTIAVLLPLLCVHAYGDFYWKDYTGKIPEDAFPAGYDVNNKTTYVGLVYLAGEGVFPATIFPYEKTVFAAFYGPKPSKNFVQILCTDNPDHLHWIPTNKTHFQYTTMYKQLVRGGIVKYWTHIGRINYQQELLVGKILSERVVSNNAQLFFVYKGEELAADSYDVLVFDKSGNNEVVDVNVQK